MKIIKKTQSIIEYAGLVTLVIVAVGAMMLTVSRIISVRVRDINQELNESQR